MVSDLKNGTERDSYMDEKGDGGERGIETTLMR